MKAQVKNSVIGIKRVTLIMFFSFCAFIFSFSQPPTNYFQGASFFDMYWDSYSQQWYAWSASAVSIVKGLDSNLFFSGAGPGSNVTFIKAGPMGNRLWSLHYTDPLASNPPNNYHYYYLGQSAQTEADSGYVTILGFQINNLVMWDQASWIVKLDKNGNYLWANNYSTDTTVYAAATTKAFTIISNYSGGFITAGKGPVSSGVLVINCDHNGNIIWKKYYQGAPLFAEKIVKTKDSGYLVFGSEAPSGGIVSLLKIDSSGNVQFYKRYFPGNCYAWEFTITASSSLDEYFILGNSKDHNTVGAESPFILSVDTLGNPNWFKVYGTADSVFAADIISPQPGNIFVCGARARDKVGELSYFKTDGTGNLQWSRSKQQNIASVYNSGSQGTDLLNFNGDLMMIGWFSGEWMFSHLSPQAEGICNYTDIYWDVDSFPITYTSSIPVAHPDVVLHILPPPFTMNFDYNVPSQIICPLISGIEENALENNISIYPNPSSGIFTIASEEIKIKSVEVINVLGEKTGAAAVSSGSNSQITFDLSSEPDGIYFIRIISDIGVISKKIIVSK